MERSSEQPSDRPLQNRRILLVIGGGIAAYKSLDLIRRLRERGAAVRPVLTKGAQEFVTPLAAAALAGDRAHTDLFDRADEADIGHIKLARDADVVVVAPATANLMGRMAGGFAPDLASTVLLATTLPILIALTENPWDALWVLGFVVVYQQFENYVLQPRITARTVDIHPAVAFGSVVAGTALLGAVGALIAIPVTATLQGFFAAYVRRYEVTDPSV